MAPASRGALHATMGLTMEWYQLKTFIAYSLSLSMDALHILVGTLALLAICRIFRVPVSDRRPWLALLAIELINEGSDVALDLWPDLARQLGEAAKDVMLTMAVPTLLLLLARYWPQSLARSVDHNVAGGTEVRGAGGAVPGDQHDRETGGKDATHRRSAERIIDQTVD